VLRTSLDSATGSPSANNALHEPTEAKVPLQTDDQDRYVSQDNYKPETLAEAQQQTGPGLSASRRPPRTIILHYSPFKAAWDWLVLLLVIYVAVSTPYFAAFLSMQQSGTLTLVVLDLAVDVMFMADMIVNFRTSFVLNGEVIVDAKLIAVNYLRGWFFIDAVSAIPFDFFLSMTGASDVRIGLLHMSHIHTCKHVRTRV